MAEKIDLRPKILEFIKKNGPSIPRDLVKEFGGDILIVGAFLMQLKDSGKIFVSHTKIGGTPAYYCKGQEEMLQNLEKYLNDKERYAYDLLKEKKILRDYDLPTVVRLSLRIIKDFATPLVVDVNGEDEIFWKWYLTSLVDAEDLIKQILPLITPRVLEKTEVEEEKQEMIEEKEVVIDMANEIIEKEEDREDVVEKEDREEAIIIDDEEDKTITTDEEEPKEEEIIAEKPQEIAEIPEEIEEEKKEVLKDDEPKKEEPVVKTKKEKKVKAITMEKVKKTKIKKPRTIHKKEKPEKKKHTSKSEKKKSKKVGFFKRIKNLFW